jgi:DNA-directed RNA polymerase subunit RPC12/RpoP
MIKAIDITPLNTTNKISYVCTSCGAKGEIILGNSINIDNDGNLDKGEVLECPGCNKQL